MVRGAWNRSWWAAIMAKSEIWILATLSSFVSAEPSQALSFLLERLGVWKLVYVLKFGRIFVWWATFILIGDAFSGKSMSFNSEPPAELQARMLPLEFCHHVHGVMHKVTLPLLVNLNEPIVLLVALHVELYLSLPLLVLLSLVLDLSLPLNLLFLCQSPLLSFPCLTLSYHLCFTLNLALSF